AHAVVSSEGALREFGAAGVIGPQSVASIRDLLARGRSQVVALAEREVFVDAVAARSRLIVVGAVHIAAALCEFAAKAGFAVTVVDPRERLNNRDRFPQATRLAVGWPEDVLPELRFDDDTYVAVLTHDEKFDDPTLD